MANTFTLISTVTLGSAAASIDFSAIPQTFTDILVIASCKTDRGTYNVDGLQLEFNGVTTGYTARYLEGNGSTAVSSTFTFWPAGWTTTSTVTANTFANSSCYIPNYTSSNYKSGSTDAVTETNGTTAGQYITANLWSNTAAITSIKLKSSTGSTLQQYSTASLYGILKGSGGASVS